MRPADGFEGGRFPAQRDRVHHEEDYFPLGVVFTVQMQRDDQEWKTIFANPFIRIGARPSAMSTCFSHGIIRTGASANVFAASPVAPANAVRCASNLSVILRTGHPSRRSRRGS